MTVGDHNRAMLENSTRGRQGEAYIRRIQVAITHMGRQASSLTAERLATSCRNHPGQQSLSADSRRHRRLIHHRGLLDDDVGIRATDTE
ncbi:hypothetical protein ACFXG4_51215, partial [Nocardia sp. NPDC059246]|uniref:hypothetical protein n=1 Tax=Nocardia sp. NPDC059246 TaxID=3346789 RepID=UPI00369ECA4F